MISLGDRCLSCIIDHISSYATFSSLPSEACESILLLLKGKVAMTKDLLSKFSRSYITCLDISKEDQLDYSEFMNFLASTPSSSTISFLNVAYSEFDDEDVLLLPWFPLLSSLNLSHCYSLNGFNFSSLGSLSSLNLRGCTGLHGDAIRTIVSRSPSLATFILSKCTQLTDSDLEPLRTLTNLRTLKLDHCDKITSGGIQHISRLTQLRHLSASHCPELHRPNSCAALKDLINLQYLDLSYCNMNDESFPPSALRSLSSLLHLELNMNKLSSHFIESVSVSLLDLRVLELGQSANLHKDDIVCLNRLPHLETMHMSNGRRDRSRISIDQATLKSLTLLLSPSTRRLDPTIPQERQLDSSIPTFSGDLNKPIVLLGEDELFQARLVKAVLERKNFIVQVACDGIMAYNMYREEYKKFSLVMMDIFLPKMDGLQSIRLIRKFEAENKSKHIPVIVCSGNPQIKTKQGSYLEESGGDLFIPKPFPKSLVGLIISMTTKV